MKQVAYILVGLCLSVSAQAYEDYQYKKWADCMSSDDSSLELIVESAPANSADLTLNVNGVRTILSGSAKYAGNEGTSRIVEFKGQSSKSREGLIKLSGYVEYCGTYCGQDKGEVTIEHNIKDKTFVKTVELNCKKLE